MFSIELESTKNGLLVLHADGGVHGSLDFYPARAGQRTRLPLTPEQFRKFAYDIEAHAEAVHGIWKKDLEIYAVNLTTGEREQVTYAQALQVLAAIDDEAAAAALEEQAKQRAELDAELKAKAEARAAAEGTSDGGTTSEPEVEINDNDLDAPATPGASGTDLAALMAEAAARAGV